MRKPLIAGNWKMNKTDAEAKIFVSDLRQRFQNYSQRDILIFPSFIALKVVSEILLDTAIKTGAQNFYPEKSGAFTGEISYSQLLDLRCSYVLIGHSERRAIFKETHELINKKVLVSIEKGLSPVLCVGETLEQKKALKTRDVLTAQITNALKGLTTEKGRYLTIAYEPIWAIGTGLTAQPEEIQQNHAFIRSMIFDLFDGDAAENIRILYGGSVKPENISGIMQNRDVDGVLVGGASLDMEKFSAIINYGE